MTKHTFLTILIGLSGWALQGQPLNMAKWQTTQREIFPYQSQHVHGSSIVALPNGDLLSCWFQGSGERQANDVRIMGSRLQKGTNRWSQPFEMADTQRWPDCNPVLFLNNKGKLFLVWIAVLANRWEQSLLRVKTSTDFRDMGAPKWQWQDNILLHPDSSFAEQVEQGLKAIAHPSVGWSEYAPAYDKMIISAAKDAQKNSIGWMTRIKPLLYDNGRIVLPLYSDGFNLSLMAISDDDGEHWKASAPLVSRGGIQPALALRKNGDIVALMRDNGDAPGRIQMSVSRDRGAQWTPASDIQIPNPGSSLELITLLDGRWLLVCNDLEEGRYALSLYLSNDEGMQWQKIGILANDSLQSDSFSYPAMIQDEEGRIHITYSHHSRYGGKSIVHSILKPETISTSK